MDTMNEAFRVGNTIIEDWSGRKHIKENCGTTAGSDLGAVLAERGVEVVNFVDWERIDKTEKEWGKKKGKPREKMVKVDDLVESAKGGEEK